MLKACGRNLSNLYPTKEQNYARTDPSYISLPQGIGRVHGGFLDLPAYVTGDIINVCDIKVVSRAPPLGTIPSLFCKGTVGWKTTFWLAL